MKQRAIIAVICCAWLSAAEAEETVVFSGGAKEPYVLNIGDSANWGIPVAAEGKTATVNGYLNVNTIPENGVKTATWNGDGEAQLFLSSPQPVDMAAAVEADAALVMIVNISEPPGGEVTLRMGCGYPCAANADISRLLGALPAGEWVRVSVDMQCFVDGGLDAASVDTPLLLLTSKALTLSIADVRIIDGAGPSSIIKCR